MLSMVPSEDFDFGTDGAGYAFFDRDPHWFPLVLAHLRDGPSAALPDGDRERAVLYREARYYSLEGLCQRAKERSRIVVVGGSRSHEVPGHPCTPLGT